MGFSFSEIKHSVLAPLCPLVGFKIQHISEPIGDAVE